MKSYRSTYNNALFDVYKWGLIVLIYMVMLLALRDNHNQMYVVRLCILSSIAVLGFEVVKIGKLSNSFITPSLIYLGLYYVFQNGLLVLFAFQDDIDSPYLRKFNDYIVVATIYSSISNVIAGYACIVSSLYSRPRRRELEVDRLNPRNIYNASFLGFVITGLIAIPLVLVKFNVARVGGYRGVRAFEENIPFFVNFIEYLFMPFAVLSIMYAKKGVKKMLVGITIFWLLLTSFCGDRTVGLSGILIVAFINLKTSGQKVSKKSIFKFGLVLVLLMIMVQAVAIVRTQGDISTMGAEEGPLMHFMSELGFSSVTLFAMMDVVPNHEQFLNGSGYLASLFSGIVPANADPTGFVKWIMEYRNVYNVWFEKYFTYSFGLGFSLNSEAYINFGWFGFLPLFFINWVVFHFLNYANPRRNPSKFDQYTCYILLFLWCTLPRRDSYYIWKALVYSVILVRWYLNIAAKSKRSTVYA